MMREELGAEDAEKLVPLANGGVALHKIFGLMHDCGDMPGFVCA